MREQVRHRKSASGLGARHLAIAFSALALLLAFPLSARAATLHTPTAFSPFDASAIGVSNIFGVASVGVDETSGNLFLPNQASPTPGFEHEGIVYILGSEGGVPASVASPYRITGFNFEKRSVSAVDNSATSPSKGTLYVVDVQTLTGAVKRFVRNAGTEQYEAAGELTAVPSLGIPGGVAVDENGNVYVASKTAPGAKFGRITKFSPSGTQLAQFDMAEATTQPSTLAVDSAGDLFATLEGGRLIKFSANGLGELEASNFAEVPLPGNQAGQVAVDRPSNTLFIPQGNMVAEYDATSLIEKGTFGGGDVIRGSGVAMNHAAGLIYVADPGGQDSEVHAFTLNGPTLADTGTSVPSPLGATKVTLNGIVNPREIAVGECKFEYKLNGAGSYEASLPCEGALPTDNAGHPVTAQLSGLTPNTGYRYRLITTNSNGANQSSEKLFITEPLAKTTAATAITPASATLNGVARPEGSPLSECKFEYGLTKAYGATLPCSPEAGAIPADFEPHTVSANLTDLLVGTTYHYRLVVDDGLATKTGADLSFTTLGPCVDRLFVSLLTDTSANLGALVNPRGKATTYHFEYGSQGACDANPCTDIPVPDASAGSINATKPSCNPDETANGCISDVKASQPIKGLSANTTYHYRIVVTNPDGTGKSVESTFTTYKPPSGFDPCPDERFRAELPSAKLPDCRVYEQATPIAKNGNDANGTTFKVQASPSGDGITSQTYGGIPGGEGAQNYPFYLSQRGATGWSTQGLLPPPPYGDITQLVGWTPDLSYSFARAGLAGSDQGEDFDSALLIRSSATGAVQQITPYLSAGVNYASAGASADNSKLFFEAEGKGVNLTGNAATGKHNLYLYEPASEELSLVGVLPGGSAPPGGSFAGPFDWWSLTTPKSLLEGGALGISGDFAGGVNGYTVEHMNAISADGSKAFFTAGATGQVYVREGIGGEDPQTAHVSASQRGAPDPNGAKPATFLHATPDGSKAFFMSCQKLTDDATAHSTAANRCETSEQGQDLYAYDTESKELTDLTVDAGDPQGAEVIGFLGASDDGSYVYFVANGDLDGSEEAETGDCRHPIEGVEILESYSGACNLYVWHAGASSFIAEIDTPFDVDNWLPRATLGSGIRSARVSADGQTVVFRSRLQQTGYDLETLEPFVCAESLCPEFYRYHLGDPEVTCVSCNPTGAPPVAPPSLDSFDAPISVPFKPTLKRFLSSSGERVFFETRDKLVAADVNGDDGCPRVGLQGNIPSCLDVYEWEAPGAGSCEEASPAFSEQNGGCIYLLSTGTSPSPSQLGDASLSGDDVFIFTRDQLVPSDKDQLVDVYDAKVGGGLASQNEPPPPPPCEGGTCRKGTNTPPSTPSAGTASFSAPATPPVKRCPKGKVRKRGKCVKPKPKPRKHRAKQRAGAKQGGRK
jgi:hypothetical protein